jgi:ankyrin repeat protein
MNDRGLDRMLLLAAKFGDPDSVKTWLDMGASVDALEADLDGLTPLMVAAQCGHARVARLLIERGANVNASALLRYDFGI